MSPLQRPIPPILGALLLACPAPGSPVPAPCAPGALGARPRPAAPAARAALAAAGPARPARPVDELPAALVALGSPDPAARDDARRWLASHAAPRDLAAVAAAARDGGAATRDGLAAALSAEDVGLGLAVLLATDTAPPVAAVGRAALRGQVLRWWPELDDAPLGSGDVPPSWWEDRGVLLELDLGRGSLAEVVERLDRLGGPPAPILLDPTLHPGVRRVARPLPAQPGRIDATWLELVAGLAQLHGLAVHVHGVPPYDDRGGARARPVRARDAAFVLLGRPGGRSAAAEGAPAVARVVAWCEGVVAPGDPAWQSACARSLGALGWPAATLWLADRWLATGDASALEGALVATARREVAPALVRPEVVRALLAEVDRRLAANEAGSLRFAERAARALAALPQVDAGGEALGPELLAGWRSADAVGRWVRLVALEGHGRTVAGAPAASLAAEVLADASSAGPLLLQALLTWVAVADGAAPPRLEQPAALLAAAAPLGRTLGALLASSRVDFELADSRLPPGGDAPPGAGPREALVRWGAARAALGGAPLALLALVQDELRTPAGRRRLTAAGRAVHEAGDGAALLEAVAGLRPGAAGPFDAWILESGLADAATRGAALARAEGADFPVALQLLPGLVADRDLGTAARLRLSERLASWIAASSEPDAATLAAVTDAVTRASLALRRARLDAEEDEFSGTLRSLAGRAGHPLSRVLYAADWPPAPPRRPVPLDALERRWGG